MIWCQHFHTLFHDMIIMISTFLLHHAMPWWVVSTLILYDMLRWEQYDILSWGIIKGWYVHDGDICWWTFSYGHIYMYDLSLSTYVYSASILMVLRQSITCFGFTNIRWYHGLFRGNVKLRTMFTTGSKVWCIFFNIWFLVSTKQRITWKLCSKINDETIVFNFDFSR